MKQRVKIVPAVYLLLEKDGKILFVERQNTEYFNGYFSLPAGHLEESESLTEALAREMREEIGIAPLDSELVHTMWRAQSDETGERMDFFFRAQNWKGEIENLEPHKCKRLFWFAKDELPEKIMPHVRMALEYIEDGKNFSELTKEYYRQIQPDFPEYIRLEELK